MRWYLCRKSQCEGQKLPQTKAALQLVKCGCKKSNCSSKCSCQQNNLACTELCTCGADEDVCTNSATEKVHGLDDNETSDSL